MQKNNLTPVLASLALLTFIGVIWYVYDSYKKDISSVSEFASPSSSQDNTASRIPPSGWKEYRNTAYAISFFYPEGLAVKEFKESGSAMTVTFEDMAGGKEFQMFIIPYALEEITPERFKLDVSSGVREKESDITIAGTRGKQFYSKDARLGETSEIWFVHNKFLYEVTTHKELDAWLRNILATVMFVL
jgi:hypothetical protein